LENTDRFVKGAGRSNTCKEEHTLVDQVRFLSSLFLDFSHEQRRILLLRVCYCADTFRAVLDSAQVVNRDAKPLFSQVDCIVRFASLVLPSDCAKNIGT
jgi:hypothetical protein